MRSSIVVAALFLGCVSADVPRPFPYGRAFADCGPADGPSVRIHLANRPLPDDLLAAPSRPYLDLVINRSISEAGGRTYPVDEEGRGASGTSQAQVCAENRECVSAGSGRIRLDRAPAGGGARLEGRYELTMPDGAIVSGRFSATWIEHSPMCG